MPGELVIVEGPGVFPDLWAGAEPGEPALVPRVHSSICWGVCHKWWCFAAHIEGEGSARDLRGGALRITLRSVIRLAERERSWLMGEVAKSRRPSRRKEDRVARRKRVLRGALDLIEAGGLEGLSLHKLAKYLGYTVGALYRYFPSKDALIAALQCDVIETLGEAFEGLWQEVREDQAWCALPEDVREAGMLLVTVDFYVAYATRSPAHFRLNSRMMSDPRPLINDEDAMAVFLVAGRIWQAVGQMLHQARLFTCEQEAAERALVLWSAMHGVMQSPKLMRFSSGNWEMHGIMRTFLQTMLLGWGIQPAVLEQALSWVDGFLATYPLDERASLEGEENRSDTDDEET